MNESLSWYVAVDDTTAGPVTTELLVRGIEHRKVPPEAMVCAAGTGRWQPLAAVEAFHAAVVRSYPPPPLHSDEARRWQEQGFEFPRLAPLPSFEYPLEDETPLAAPVAVAPLSPEQVADAPKVLRLDDVSLDDDWEDESTITDEVPVDLEPAIDWREPFEPFFLVGDEVDLPEEGLLLESLKHASRDTFRENDALWNLALCLAFGSDAVGAAAADAFFAAVGEGGADKLEWMTRTLRGNGFVHSGIPADAGTRAVRRLRSSCPPALVGKLS